MGGLRPGHRGAPPVPPQPGQGRVRHPAPGPDGVVVRHPHRGRRGRRRPARGLLGLAGPLVGRAPGRGARERRHPPGRQRDGGDVELLPRPLRGPLPLRDLPRAPRRVPPAHPEREGVARRHGRRPRSGGARAPLRARHPDARGLDPPLPRGRRGDHLRAAAGQLRLARHRLRHGRRLAPRHVPGARAGGAGHHLRGRRDQGPGPVRHRRPRGPLHLRRPRGPRPLRARLLRSLPPLRHDRRGAWALRADGRRCRAGGRGPGCAGDRRGGGHRRRPGPAGRLRPLVGRGPRRRRRRRGRGLAPERGLLGRDPAGAGRAVAGRAPGERTGGGAARGPGPGGVPGAGAGASTSRSRSSTA